MCLLLMLLLLLLLLVLLLLLLLLLVLQRRDRAAVPTAWGQPQPPFAAEYNFCCLICCSPSEVCNLFNVFLFLFFVCSLSFKGLWLAVFACGLAYLLYLFFNLLACLFIYLFVCLIVYLFIYLFIFIYLFNCLFICYFSVFVWSFLCLSIFHLFCLFANLFVN